MWESYAFPVLKFYCLGFGFSRAVHGDCFWLCAGEGLGGKSLSTVRRDHAVFKDSAGSSQEQSMLSPLSYLSGLTLLHFKRWATSLGESIIAISNAVREL